MNAALGFRLEAFFAAFRFAGFLAFFFVAIEKSPVEGSARGLPGADEELPGTEN